MVGGKTVDMVFVFFAETRPDGWFACGITEDDDKASEYLHGGANKPPVKGR